TLTNATGLRYSTGLCCGTGSISRSTYQDLSAPIHLQLMTTGSLLALTPTRTVSPTASRQSRRIWEKENDEFPTQSSSEENSYEAWENSGALSFRSLVPLTVG